ncbi:unnamed protein product [Linum tenue]|uniref:Cytochrome b561 domain-containing protein n=1 Tax=Linum tenue TaxID=586396 RepID=A0AAV0MZJ2_9ROSI|nr:unnamed protein product [Linum tenue]
MVQSLASSTATFILLLTIVPIACSFQGHPQPRNGHSISSDDHDKLKDDKLLFEITVHGFLLWASMGFLAPVGMLAIRLSHREECGTRLKILFYLHSISQASGAVLSFKNFTNSFNNHHQRIGLSLYGIIWLQALVGFIRPPRGSKRRSLWFLVHWMIGTTVCLLGIINVYTGLVAYHEKTSRSITKWIVALTVEVCLLALLYLFQDKWAYIRKQGVILGNDPAVRSIDRVVVFPQDNNKHKETQSISLVQESL